MKVIIYGQPEATQFAAVADGFRAHGIAPEWRLRHGPYEPSDLGIIWGHKAGQIKNHVAARQDYLVVELAYFRDRKSFISLGFNGLNGRAEMYNQNCPPDRWQRHGVPVSPWKEGGEYILIMGQVQHDASLAHCPDYIGWLHQVAEQAKAYGLPVYFRPHPKARAYPMPAPEMKGSLDEALAGAAAVIAWNSNSLVDAAIAGVPVIAGDRGSMAWPVAAHEVGADIVRPDRAQWLNNLAYTQWTVDEIAAGMAWAHLRQRYNGQPIEPPSMLPPPPRWKKHTSTKVTAADLRQRRREKFEAREQQLIAAAGQEAPQ